MYLQNKLVLLITSPANQRTFKVKEMALRTKEELENKIKELRTDRQKFSEFLRDTYGDKQCGHKIEIHTWRISREIEILEWVLDQGLPFLPNNMKKITPYRLKKIGFFYDHDNKTWCHADCTLQLEDYQNEGFMAIVYGYDLRLIMSMDELKDLFKALTGTEL